MTTFGWVDHAGRLVEWEVAPELAERIARGELYIELYGAETRRYTGEDAVERLESDSAALRRQLDELPRPNP